MTSRPTTRAARARKQHPRPPSPSPKSRTPSPRKHGKPDLETALARQFAGIPISKIDGEVTRALRTLAQQAGMERCFLLLLSPEGNTLERVYESGGSKAGDRRARLEGMPEGELAWTLGRLRGGRRVRAPRVAALPAAAREEQWVWDTLGYKSVLARPLVYEQALIGAVGFAGVRREREWGREEEKLLETAIPILAAALGRRRAELEWHESESKFRQLFDLDSDAILLVEDGTGRLIDVNTAASEMHGYGWDELVRMEYGQLLAEPDPANRLWPGSHPYHRRKDGSLFPVEIAVRNITWRGRSVLLTLIRDVSERKQAEDAARVMARFFDSTMEGMVITDVHGTIEAVNAAFSRVTGYAAEEAVGNTPRLLKSGKQDDEFYRQMWADLTTKRRWQGEIWNRRKSGEIYPEWLTIGAVEDETHKVTHYMAVFTDISSLKEAEARLRHLATHDWLTGLPNRLLFHDRLNQALARAQRNRQFVLVMLLDLDNFKVINDTYGHPKGDEVLQAVAERLERYIRKSDTVARMGGDEFSFVLENVTNVRDGVAIAQTIMRGLGQPLRLGEQTFTLTGSIGISIYPTDGEDAESLFKFADVAMYEAKQFHNRFRFYRSPAFR